jgi:hypothetical protein
MHASDRGGILMVMSLWFLSIFQTGFSGLRLRWLGRWLAVVSWRFLGESGISLKSGILFDNPEF